MHQQYEEDDSDSDLDGQYGIPIDEYGEEQMDQMSKFELSSPLCRSEPLPPAVVALSATHGCEHSFKHLANAFAVRN